MSWSLSLIMAYARSSATWLSCLAKAMLAAAATMTATIAIDNGINTKRIL
jgi:hypothetical protein